MDLIDTVKEFGSASLGLLAWEFSTSEPLLRPAWERCVLEELLDRIGEDPDSGETIYTLSERGHQVLAAVRAHSPDPAARSLHGSRLDSERF